MAFVRVLSIERIGTVEAAPQKCLGPGEPVDAIRLTVYSTSHLVKAANSTTALQGIVDGVQLSDQESHVLSQNVAGIATSSPLYLRPEP